MPTRDELFALKIMVRDEIPGHLVFFLKGEGGVDYAMDDPVAEMFIPFALMLPSGGVILVGSIPEDRWGVYIFLEHLDCFPAGLLEEVDTPAAGIGGSHTALKLNFLIESDDVPFEGWKMEKVPSNPDGDTHVGVFRTSSCSSSFAFIKFLIWTCFCMTSGEPLGAAAGDM